MNFVGALKISLLIALGYWLGSLPLHEYLPSTSEVAELFRRRKPVVQQEVAEVTVKPKEIVAGPLPQISAYDGAIRAISKDHRLDWRLISSIIFVESSFEAKAVSPKGAQGLMQIMPVVAKEFGIKNVYHPETNIAVGVKHLLRWYNMMKGATPDDRLKFALAAFNGGPGHVKDAQVLAYRLKKNPLKWDHVREVLPLLEHKLYNWDLSTGYCEGTGMVSYVEKIMAQYKKYSQTFPQEIAAHEFVAAKPTS